MNASSIYEITGRPVPQTTNQTVGDVSNISLPEQNDLTSDVSRVDPVPDIFFRPRPMPQRLHLNVCIRTCNNIRPLSSNGLFTPSTFQSSVCIISTPSEYIHTMHNIPYIKINDDIQFRDLKLDSSLPNNMYDTTIKKCYQPRWHTSLSQHIGRLYSSLRIYQSRVVLPRTPRGHDRLRMQRHCVPARPRHETKMYRLQSRGSHSGIRSVFRISYIGTFFQWNDYKSWVTPCCLKAEHL